MKLGLTIAALSVLLLTPTVASAGWLGSVEVAAFYDDNISRAELDSDIESDAGLELLLDGTRAWEYENGKGFDLTGNLGYNYRSNDVVGVSVVGVPIENVHEVALQRTGIVIGVLTVLFAIIFITINLLVKRYLLKPILHITNAAHEISRGKLDIPIEVDRNDEMGDLARSVELVRRSFDKLIKRMRKS